MANKEKQLATIFLGFEMKIKTILEIAFPHCIVRSFHYVRVSLPASGAGVTEPREAPAHWEAASPRLGSHPASGGQPRASPPGLVRWGHTLCVHIPLGPAALQPRHGATLWVESFLKDGALCPSLQQKLVARGVRNEKSSNAKDNNYSPLSL